MNIFELLFGWTGYEPTSFFFSGANILINTTFCLLFEYIPLIKYLRVKPRTAILLNFLLLLLNGLILLCFPAIVGDSGKGQMFGLVLYFAMFIPLALFLLKGCFLQNIFLIAFSQCAMQFILGIGNYIEFRFGDLFSPNIQYEVALVSKLIIYPIFFFFASRILCKLFSAWDNDTETQSFWKVLWLIPAVLATLTAISGTVDRLTDEISLSFLLSRIFSMTALFISIIMMTDIMNIERETAAARLRADTMKTAGEALQKSRAESEKTLLEMNNAKAETAIAVKQIIAFSKSGKHDEITALLREKTALLDTFAIERFCENESVNALVTYYKSFAENAGINVICKLDIPRTPGKIANVDLSRIIGNMLENAIEACRLMDYGVKKIILQSRVSGDMLVFGMSNSFDGEIKLDPDGNFTSRKRESGIATGLRSIRFVAEKYNGSVKFEAADRIFKTSARLDMAGE
jgi:signal transduction histidine kinase